MLFRMSFVRCTLSLYLLWSLDACDEVVSLTARIILSRRSSEKCAWTSAWWFWSVNTMNKKYSCKQWHIWVTRLNIGEVHANELFNVNEKNFLHDNNSKWRTVFKIFQKKKKNQYCFVVLVFLLKTNRRADRERRIINYLISFLHNRTAVIELENVLSRPFKLRSGTPQVSPLLYIIYTADSMNRIPTHTEHGLFADDTALWTSSNGLDSLCKRLQQSIDAFESWCKSWKLRLQPTKTEIVYFSLHPRRKHNNTVVVKVDNIDVKPLDQTRYLGVIISKQMKWRKHLEHIERRIAPRISLLRYLARSATEPNTKTMINIYKALIRSIIIYGSPVILTADQVVWKRLQVLQNKAF